MSGRMYALLLLVCVFAISVNVVIASTNNFEKNNEESKKVELFEGVSVKIPQGNDTSGKLMSLEIETGRDIEQGRGKQKKIMERILPLFIMPFVLQSTIVPLFLSMLKFMLFKSLMVGKLALFLIILNAFKNHNTYKGRDAEMANVHYGYHASGMEEIGSYMNH